MRSIAVFIAVPLLVAGGMAARSSDAARVTPRAAPGAASVLGGFTALAVQVLWLRADQAVAEMREDDAQLAFSAISELEPQLVASGDYIARSLGFSLAEGHKDPAVRWALGREGWRVLCRTVERNPGEARAFASRARYALIRMNIDPSMHAGFLKDVDPVGPLEWACRDAERAIALRPQWREPWDLDGIASTHRGLELLERSEFADAGRRFERARAAFEHVKGVLAEEKDPALDGDREMTQDSIDLSSALADVCAAPPTERAARYEEVRKRFGDAPLPPFPQR